MHTNICKHVTIHSLRVKSHNQTTAYFDNNNMCTTTTMGDNRGTWACSTGMLLFSFYFSITVLITCFLRYNDAPVSTITAHFDNNDEPKTCIYLLGVVSPLPLLQAAQPLHHQRLCLLWPISAPIQSQACVPSPSYAHRSWLFTPHAPTSWHPVPSRLFALFMTSCMHSSRSRHLFAQRMILELVCSWARRKRSRLRWGCFFFNFWNIGAPLHQERQWCPHTQRSSCHCAQHGCNCERKPSIPLFHTQSQWSSIVCCMPSSSPGSHGLHQIWVGHSIFIWTRQQHTPTYTVCTLHRCWI